jgi:hypothetical protein
MTKAKVPALSRDEAMSLLSYDAATGEFRWRRAYGWCIHAGAIAGTTTKLGYRRIHIAGCLVMGHRLAWWFVNGRWPLSQLDHINGDKLDNRIANLREVSPTANSQNLRSAKTRKAGGSLLGATWAAPNKKWRAVISVGGKQKHLGLFDTAEAAHATYIKAKRALHAGCTL